MPRVIVVPSLILTACLIALADYLSPPALWYGPAYLLLIAFAAWALGRRHAIGLGLIVISVNLLVGSSSEYPYGPESTLLNFTFRLVAVVSIVLLLGGARSALEKEWRLARTDQLTGALNRQAFFEVVGANDASPCWSVLIYADLDGLKHVNDTLGHKQGDGSIVAFARRVRSAIRKDDLFARMGGDEFVILMNVRDEQAGILVANRLNRVFNVEVSDADVHLLSSLGVLILPPGMRYIDAELKAADALMYEAKRTKIGMLVATAKLIDREIVISRRIPHAPPADRKTAIRWREREPEETGELLQVTRTHEDVDNPMKITISSV